MSNRRLQTMDLHALVRRLRAHKSDNNIAKAMHLDRRTVAKYRAWATAQHLLDASREMPDLKTLHALAEATLEPITPPPQNQSSVEGYTEQIRTLLEQGLGPYLIYKNWRPNLASRPVAPPCGGSRGNCSPSRHRKSFCVWKRHRARWLKSISAK